MKKRVWVSVGALLILAAILAITLSSDDESAFDTDGPLTSASGLAVFCNIQPDRPFYFGGVVLKNQGSENLVLKNVELFDASEELELVGTQSAGPERLFYSGGGKPRRILGFICNRKGEYEPPITDRGELEGTVVPPKDGGGRQGVELIMQLQPSGSRTQGFQGVRVTYSREGLDDEEELTLESQFWICITQDLNADCPVPSWVDGDGHP